MMSNKSLILEALKSGEGVVRLAPCWVPRSFLMPGGRLKLDPRDLYALGAHRGGIDERWFASTTKAANGPLTGEDEGLSYIEFNGKKALLKDAIETLGDQFLGSNVMERYGGWIDPGILHAPGSLVTYEPQVNSDVFAMYQSLVEGRGVPWDLLVKDVPENHHHDFDYLIDMMDWAGNVDPNFSANRLFHPSPMASVQECAPRDL